MRVPLLINTLLKRCTGRHLEQPASFFFLPQRAQVSVVIFTSPLMLSFILVFSHDKEKTNPTSWQDRWRWTGVHAQRRSYPIPGVWSCRSPNSRRVDRLRPLKGDEAEKGQRTQTHSVTLSRSNKPPHILAQTHAHTHKTFPSRSLVLVCVKSLGNGWWEKRKTKTAWVLQKKNSKIHRFSQNVSLCFLNEFFRTGCNLSRWKTEPMD